MIILPIVGLILVAVAVAIIGTKVLNQGGGERSSRLLRRMRSYGFGQRAQAKEEKAGVREKVDDMATKVGTAVVGRSSSTSTDAIQADLLAAGLYNISPLRFQGYRVLCTLGFPILWIWLATTIGVKVPLLIIITLFTGVLGWILPTRILHDRATQRLNEIDYQLPELIDLLVVTVEAGLGFVGSLQTASTRISGPLGEEIRLTLQEQNMGLSIQEALLKMLDRVDTPSMRSFVRSVVQGESLGVSIGQIMRDLAHEMRRRRRANAQEKAQKAPIKILFPLVFLIFPPMFIVLLGPALILFFRALGGGGV
jgi:tight adherence protein C